MEFWSLLVSLESLALEWTVRMTSMTPSLEHFCLVQSRCYHALSQLGWVQYLKNYLTRSQGFYLEWAWQWRTWREHKRRQGTGWRCSWTHLLARMINTFQDVFSSCCLPWTHPPQTETEIDVSSSAATEWGMSSPGFARVLELELGGVSEQRGTSCVMLL